MTNVQSIARATLNIGHDIPLRHLKHGQKATLESEAILAVLKALGIQVIESACYQSDTETTTVAAIAVPLSPKQGHLLAELLFQDAIVQFKHGSVEESALYGSKAEEGGEFNPEYFLTLTGGRLASELVDVEVKLVGRDTPFTSYIFTVKSGPSAGLPVLTVAAPSNLKGQFTKAEYEHIRERLTEKTGADAGSFCFSRVDE